MADFTPITWTPPPIPQAPSVPVANPTTVAQESYLRDQLDPSKATYIGNRFLPELQRAGQNLKQGLEGYGDYTFRDEGNGLLAASKGRGQPGRLYREEYQGARAQANAQGMLYSRTATQAVGDAWHRLGDQERQIFNQYSSQTNDILGRQAAEFSGIVNQLQGLYGQDIQFALDNPIITPAPPAPAAAPTAPTVGAGISNKTWHGTVNPSKSTLSRIWGVPASQIKVENRDGQYVAYAR